MMVRTCLLLACLQAVLGSECFKFECGSNNPQGTCVLYNSTDATFNVNPCSAGPSNKTYCPASDPQKINNYTCEVPPKPTPPTLYPGDKCEKYNCTYGTCQFKDDIQICEGISKGQNCTKTEECNPGLYCHEINKQKVCTPLVKEGGNCTSDYDCLNNLGCDIKSGENQTGTCKKYFSIKDRAEVQSCNMNLLRNILCQSNFCDEKNGTYYCASPVSSNSSVPTPCESREDCESTLETFFDSTYTSRCECGLNKNGTKYCSLLPGDKESKEFHDIAQNWVSSSAISKCHTHQRGSMQCMYDWWNLADASTFKYYQSRSLNWPKLQNTEDCVVKVYLKDYYQALADYNKYRPDPDDDDNDDNDDSFAYFLLASTLYLVFF